MTNLKIQNQITDSLDKFFAKYDLQYINLVQDYYISKLQALRDVRNQRIADNGGKRVPYNDADSFVDIDTAGGIGMLKLIIDNNWGYGKDKVDNNHPIKDSATKYAQTVIKKRNAKIGYKLSDAGITKIYTASVTDTDDGFDGLYKVATNDGDKTIKINTIIAGGYNIQAKHYRTLFKIK